MAEIMLSEGVKMCSEHTDQHLFCPLCEPETADYYRSGGSVQGSAVLRLSDVKRDSRGYLLLSGLPDDASISGEVIRAHEAQRAALSEVKDAFMAGMILPPQRHRWEKIALSDIGNFRVLMSSMKPQVDLREHGTGSSGLEGEVPEDMVMKLTEQRAKTDGIALSEAAKLVSREHPDLVRRRQDRLRTVAGVRP